MQLHPWLWSHCSAAHRCGCSAGRLCCYCCATVLSARKRAASLLAAAKLLACMGKAQQAQACRLVTTMCEQAPRRVSCHRLTCYTPMFEMFDRSCPDTVLGSQALTTMQHGHAQQPVRTALATPLSTPNRIPAAILPGSAGYRPPMRVTVNSPNMITCSWS